MFRVFHLPRQEKRILQESERPRLHALPQSQHENRDRTESGRSLDLFEYASQAELQVGRSQIDPRKVPEALRDLRNLRGPQQVRDARMHPSCRFRRAQRSAQESHPPSQTSTSLPIERMQAHTQRALESFHQQCVRSTSKQPPYIPHRQGHAQFVFVLRHRPNRASKQSAPTDLVQSPLRSEFHSLAFQAPKWRESAPVFAVDHSFQPNHHFHLLHLLARVRAVVMCSEIPSKQVQIVHHDEHAYRDAPSSGSVR